MEVILLCPFLERAGVPMLAPGFVRGFHLTVTHSHRSIPQYARVHGRSYCTPMIQGAHQAQERMRISASKKFINSPDQVALDSIEGLVAFTPHLKRLDGFPHVKVVFDSGHDRSKVAVISGGGSGHEPFAAGLVGPGLLAAAAAGDVFASPPAESVLAAIRAVSGDAGCLLLVANYTGDRLNFGLAAEQAKAEGFNIELVIMGDDCALPHQGQSKRRGIAGCVLVCKIASAAAAAGEPLSQVAAEARQAAAATSSCGVAASVCTLPGAEPSTRLQSGQVEIGLGIHGEPGVARDELRQADDTVKLLIDKIMSEDSGFATVAPRDEATLLVNNLGSTPPSELYLVAHAAVSYLTITKEVKVTRAFVGTFCTSLDMSGFSLSLQSATPQRNERLDAPVQAPGWPSMPAAACNLSKQLQPMPHAAADLGEAGDDDASGDAELSAAGTSLKRAAQAACEALIATAAHLDSLDSKAGDGDCGSTLRRGAEAALADAAAGRIPWNNARRAAMGLASAARRMGGTSGALYDIMLHAAAASLATASSDEPTGGSQSESLPATAWATALNKGALAMQHYGGAKQGDRTMLDALLPAAVTLEGKLQEGMSAEVALLQAVQAAREGGEQTKHLQAAAGRAAYVPAESLAGIPDPGALAVATWLEAIHNALFPN